MNNSIYINQRKIDLTRPVISLDLEFSALDVSLFHKGELKRKFKTFEIIELGFVNYQNNECSYTYEQFVKPKFGKYKIDEKIKELTGIREKDLKQGIVFKEAYEVLLQHYIPGKTYLLTWGNGDLPVLKHMCEKNKLPYVVREEDFIDISKLFHEYFNINKMYSFNLEKAMNHLSINPQPKHRAVVDAKAALSVYTELINDASKGRVEMAK